MNGLQPSAAVVIKGYKVGTISDISYDPQRSNNVVVEFAIKSKFKIPKDTKARIFSDGIMSGKSIELELGRSDAYLHEGDTLFSEINKDFLEVAGSEFEFLKQRANDVISEMIVTLGSINKLLSDNSANLNATINSVAAVRRAWSRRRGREGLATRDDLQRQRPVARAAGQDGTDRPDLHERGAFQRLAEPVAHPDARRPDERHARGIEPHARESQRRRRDGRQVRQRPKRCTTRSFKASKSQTYRRCFST